MSAYSNIHLLHYWKDFNSNLKSSRVGWLGVTSRSKKFEEFNASISSSSDSWIISFRKENGQCFPVAVLKAIKNPIVDVVNDNGYVDFVYFDPWKSFKVDRPTDSTDLRKFRKLGTEIAEKFSVNCTFQGKSGLQLIANDEMLELIARASEFKTADLSMYAASRSPLVREVIESNLLFRKRPVEDQDRIVDVDDLQIDLAEQPMAPNVVETSKLDFLIILQEELKSASNQVALEYINKPGEDVKAIVKRRIGQGPFRTLLEKIYGKSCWLSGLEDGRLLIASHIIPWSLSDPIQKTDPDNGLLLSISWDALFDKGYVSFDDDGHLLCSDLLNEDTVKCLGISRQSALSGNYMTAMRKRNLAWHRQQYGFKV